MNIRPIRSLIQNIREWREFAFLPKDLTNKVIQDLDFTQHDIKWEEYTLSNTSFLGCKFNREQAIYLIENGAFIYPKFEAIPYNPYRVSLYTW